jgi:antitoxin component YwqK of YwqJK toxin-antitoxin module
MKMSNMLRNVLFLALLSFISCNRVEYYSIQNGVKQRIKLPIVKEPDSLLKVFRFKNDNKIHFEEYFNKGKRYNIRRYYYEKDGSWAITESEGFLKKENGPLYMFHPNGKVKLATHRFNGKDEGSYKTFYENGEKQCDCFYNAGKRDSIQKIYWDNGQLYMTMIYDKGKLLDVPNLFNESGVALPIGTFKNGDGTLFQYDDKEKVIRVEHYEKGILKKTEKVRN